MKLSHTNFATLMMRFLSLVVSRLTNFSSLVSLAISLMVGSALVKRSSLRGAFEVHSVRKWTSLSIYYIVYLLCCLYTIYHSPYMGHTYTILHTDRLAGYKALR